VEGATRFHLAGAPAIVSNTDQDPSNPDERTGREPVRAAGPDRGEHRTERVPMENMTFLILIGVVLIDIGVALINGKLWKMMHAQKKHHRAVEGLLAEIRDRTRPVVESVEPKTPA
jgi:hypothetical protein